MDEERQILRELLSLALEALEALTPPVTRLCGPLTTGGFGYEENMRRFALAEDILKEKGYSVVALGPIEKRAREKLLSSSHELWMEEFHAPLLASGKIHIAFFLPRWEESRGSIWEKDYIEQHTKIDIEYFPEEWFVTQI